MVPISPLQLVNLKPVMLWLPDLEMISLLPFPDLSPPPLLLRACSSVSEGLSSDCTTGQRLEPAGCCWPSTCFLHSVSLGHSHALPCHAACACSRGAWQRCAAMQTCRLTCSRAFPRTPLLVPVLSPRPSGCGWRTCGRSVQVDGRRAG